MDLKKGKKVDILIHVGALRYERLRRQTKHSSVGRFLF
jgi:hypothetical protein